MSLHSEPYVASLEIELEATSPEHSKALVLRALYLGFKQMGEKFQVGDIHSEADTLARMGDDSHKGKWVKR